MADQTSLILHLGLGSFHRAHQAIYLQDLHDLGDTRWQLAGGNLRGDMTPTIEALQAQGGAYTLETVTPVGVRDYRRITAIGLVIPHEPTLAGLIRVGASAATRIISFTVTEAGYYLDGDNRLDPSHADLASDLRGDTRGTIYGALAAILRQRMLDRAGPVTLLNCDNLRGNGERFRAGLLDFLTRRDDTALLAWVEAHTSCPNAMVDRITPRPAAEVAERVKAATGWDDQVPVMGESFMQWVIEDHFCNGRPAWEKVGAELVVSVLPYEEAKIRILNASHSCIAWAGTLIGLQFIHEGVAHPAIRRMAWDYVTADVLPCLQPSPVDLAAYRDMVLTRFSSPFLRDTNQRVAMDGYSKVAGFLWPTFQERLARHESIDKVAKLPALFFEFLGRWHRGELDYVYEDQGMDRAAAHALFDTSDPLDSFCRDAALWGPLAGDGRLIDAVTRAHGEVVSFVKDNRGA